MSVIDAVTIAFGAATVVLAVVAIGLAIGGWFVYRDIRKNAKAAAATIALATAETIAKATAEAEARKVAEIVALREIRAYIQVSTAPAEDISTAYRDEPPP